MKCSKEYFSWRSFFSVDLKQSIQVLVIFLFSMIGSVGCSAVAKNIIDTPIYKFANGEKLKPEDFRNRKFVAVTKRHNAKKVGWRFFVEFDENLKPFVEMCCDKDSWKDEIVRQKSVKFNEDKMKVTGTYINRNGYYSFEISLDKMEARYGDVHSGGRGILIDLDTVCEFVGISYNSIRNWVSKKAADAATFNCSDYRMFDEKFNVPRSFYTIRNSKASYATDLGHLLEGTSEWYKKYQNDVLINYKKTSPELRVKAAGTNQWDGVYSQQNYDWNLEIEIKDGLISRSKLSLGKNTKQLSDISFDIKDRQLTAYAELDMFNKYKVSGTFPNLSVNYKGRLIYFQLQKQLSQQETSDYLTQLKKRVATAKSKSETASTPSSATGIVSAPAPKANPVLGDLRDTTYAKQLLDDVRAFGSSNPGVLDPAKLALLYRPSLSELGNGTFTKQTSSFLKLAEFVNANDAFSAYHKTEMEKRAATAEAKRQALYTILNKAVGNVKAKIAADPFAKEAAELIKLQQRYETIKSDASVDVLEQALGGLRKDVAKFGIVVAELSSLEDKETKAEASSVPLSGTNALKTAYENLEMSERKAVQSRLTERGFYKGTIDGVYGAGTRQALDAYAVSENAVQHDAAEGAVQFLVGILKLDVLKPVQPADKPIERLAGKLKQLSDVGSEDAVLLVNLSGDAPHAFRDLNGKPAFEKKQVKLCAPALGSLKRKHRAFVRNAVSEALPDHTIQMVSECRSYRGFDGVLATGANFAKSDGLPSANETSTRLNSNKLVRMALMEQSDFTRELAKRDILASQYKADIEQGARVGYELSPLAISLRLHV